MFKNCSFSDDNRTDQQCQQDEKDKDINNGPSSSSSSLQTRNSKRREQAQAQAQALRFRIYRIYRMPPNAISSLTSLVVNKLQVADLRYNIKWAYGPFVDELPTRLGQSGALDAATRSLLMLSGGSGGHVHSRGSSSVLEYNQALRAIRLAIADPAEAYSLNTLCAIYFLWLHQVCWTCRGVSGCSLTVWKSASGTSQARVRSTLLRLRTS